jgi:phage recombination protein Bet
MTTDLTIVPESSAPAAITTYHPDQLRMLREHIAPGLSEGELGYFVEVAKSAGLNPLRKEIYAIKRGNRVAYQVAIDGFRKVAHATGNFVGCSDAVFTTEPAFGGNGVELVCTITVHRRVGDNVGTWTASARMGEYMQRGRDGRASGLWATMPKAMLAKCTEALALRKAFPNELAGLYSTDEMGQADNPQPTPAPREAACLEAETTCAPPVQRDPVTALRNWWFALCADLTSSGRLPFDVQQLPEDERHAVQRAVLGFPRLSTCTPEAAAQVRLPTRDDEEGKARLADAMQRARAHHCAARVVGGEA